MVQQEGLSLILLEIYVQSLYYSCSLQSFMEPPQNHLSLLHDYLEEKTYHFLKLFCPQSQRSLFHCLHWLYFAYLNLEANQTRLGMLCFLLYLFFSKLILSILFVQVSSCKYDLFIHACFYSQGVLGTLLRIQNHKEACKLQAQVFKIQQSIQDDLHYQRTLWLLCEILKLIIQLMLHFLCAHDNQVLGILLLPLFQEGF